MPLNLVDLSQTDLQTYKASSSRLKVTKDKAFKVSVITDASELFLLEGEIAELSRDPHVPNCFYSASLLFPAIRNFKDNTDLKFVCIWQRGREGTKRRLIGLFPLTTKKFHPFLPLKMLTLWEHTMCFRCYPLLRRDYHERGWSAFLNWFKGADNSIKLLELPSLFMEREVRHELEQIFADDMGLWFDRRSCKTAFLHPRETADVALKEAMNSKQRSNFRRIQRRLDGLGTFEFIENDAYPNLDELLDDFVALEGSGWKGKMGTAMRCIPEEAAFFYEAMKRAAHEKQFSFLGIRLDGKLIAARIHLHSANGAFGYKTAYDENYAKYSLGSVLEIEGVKRLHASRNEQNPQIKWVDSCSVFNEGPAFTTWPDRDPIYRYRVARGPVYRTFMRHVRPMVSRLIRSSQKIGKRARPQ